MLLVDYIDDNGNRWRLPVDADYVADPARGWGFGPWIAVAPLPRLWTPRYVIGVDETGRKHTTRVAHVGAPLWTGSTTGFYVVGSDQEYYIAEVTELVGEKRRA
jgi:hypothetical protein